MLKEPNTLVLNWNRQDLYIRNGIDMGSRCLYIYINSQRFKHNFTPDMLFHLESLEKKQIVNMRETKLDHRNYHDFDK